MTVLKKTLVAGAAAAALLLSMTACSNGSGTGSSGPSSGASADASKAKIGLLLPETAVARYASKDKPYFTDKMKQLCPDCTVLYQNANGNASTQQQQATSLLSQGVNVLVVDPVDGVAAASIVTNAKAKNVPVVAYDRLISSPDLAYVISNDYEKVGQLQAQALVDKLKKDGVSPSSGGIIAMNGATTDNNAGNIKKGALSVFDKSGYKILAETDTWDPAAAQSWAGSQVSKYGKKIVGVYSANDGNAGGAIAAIKAAGVKPIPPMTGLDASVAGVQAILAGDQYMTTYNAFKSEAESAATVAYELAQGKKPASTATVDGHPASLNPPQAIFADNIQSVLIADGFYKASEICTAQYQAACAKYGIK